MNKPHCWLEVRPERSPEQPRVLLVSVPNALKAADADTINVLKIPAPKRAESTLMENAPSPFHAEPRQI
jgi:hypothetical protein